METIQAPSQAREDEGKNARRVASQARFRMMVNGVMLSSRDEQYQQVAVEEELTFFLGIVRLVEVLNEVLSHSIHLAYTVCTQRPTFELKALRSPYQKET
jgi:hypothetical protein